MTPYFLYHLDSPITQVKNRWQQFLQVLGASLLMAICSQIKIDLPFTPVPLTCQTFMVMLIGAAMGSRNGALAILCYFAQISLGLPVLAGGIANPLVFFGPKGGYVLGWLLQAYLMGWCVENFKSSKIASLLMGGLLASAVQLAMGMTILAQFVGWNHVCLMGLYPFIPGDLLKIITVCFCLKRD